MGTQRTTLVGEAEEAIHQQRAKVILEASDYLQEIEANAERYIDNEMQKAQIEFDAQRQSCAKYQREASVAQGNLTRQEELTYQSQQKAAHFERSEAFFEQLSTFAILF